MTCRRSGERLWIRSGLRRNTFKSSLTNIRAMPQTYQQEREVTSLAQFH